MTTEEKKSDKKELPYNLYLLVHLLSYAEIFSKEACPLNYDILQDDYDTQQDTDKVYQYDKKSYKNTLKTGGILTFFPTKETFKIKEKIKKLLKKEYSTTSCDREWLNILDNIQNIHKIEYGSYIPNNNCVNLNLEMNIQSNKYPTLSRKIMEQLERFVDANKDQLLFIFDTLYLITYIFRSASYAVFDFNYLDKLKLFHNMVSNLKENVHTMKLTNIKKLHSKFLFRIIDLLMFFIMERNNYRLSFENLSIENIDEIVAVFEQ